MTITAQEVKPLLQGLKNGTIYSVTFVKKDGSIRLMNSIKGTRKGVTGEGLKFNPEDKGLIPVYDLQLRNKGEEESKCWRMVNVNTVQRICVDKTEYIVQ